MFTEIALIDADSIYFRVACVTQKKNEIRKGIDRCMEETRKNTGCNDSVVAVKGRGNFRKDIYDKYKTNRKDLEPHIKEALTYGHQYMVDKYDAVMADDMEADDLVSIWAAERRAEDRDYTIVGIDKDLLQIPGWHYNFVKKESQFVDHDLANLKLMLQCLTGDNSDNIPGIKGIGPKKAEKILAGVPMDRRWTTVKASWNEHKAGDPYLSRALLTMLTSFEELEIVRTSFKREGLIREQNVLAREESKDEGISGLPE